MKLRYYPETDSLYIDLADRVSADSQEVAPGVVLDFDEDGQLVGIDIDHASQVADLSEVASQGFLQSFKALKDARKATKEAVEDKEAYTPVFNPPMPTIDNPALVEKPLIGTEEGSRESKKLQD